MDNGFEALYNERRNAISSWQGYHYQGMVALLRFLEELVKKFQYVGNSVEANTLKMKIEWIEDFILFENNEIKEIYQVKKTLTDENRKEVLNNFIIQFKIFDKEAKWVLAYDETKLGDLSLTKDDFDQCYKVHIKEKWLQQIALLESHYREDNYWKNNLNLNNKDSSCKEIRAYLRKWLKKNNKKYKTEIQRESICKNYLQPLKDKLAYRDEDFKKFKSCFEFQKITNQTLDNRCKAEIKLLFPYVTERNTLLTEQDILNNLYADTYQKMMSLENKKEQENFEYEFTDIRKVFLDEENSISCWTATLYREREKLLEDIESTICSNCDDKGGRCSHCILATIKMWDMRKVIENINLEYALFSPEKAEESLTNKLSDIKHNLIIDMMEHFKSQIKLESNDILALGQQYALSALIGVSKRHNESILMGILNNYWEHSMIYRDYKGVLTHRYNYCLSEKDLSILKVNLDEEEVRPTFNEIRKTEFIDYEEIEI